MRKGDGSTDASTDGTNDGFYRRWSRRKSVARHGAPVVDEPIAPAQPEPTASDVVEHGAEQEAEPPKALTDEDMPALETLDEDSDFSGFMSEGVSEDLRLKALRKLFLSPKFNVVDGLNDYDEDFTSFEALGDIVTSDMRHQQEMEEARRAEQAAARKAEDIEDASAEAQQALEPSDAEAPREIALEQESSKQEPGAPGPGDTAAPAERVHAQESSAQQRGVLAPPDTEAPAKCRREHNASAQEHSMTDDGKGRG